MHCYVRTEQLRPLETHFLAGHPDLVLFLIPALALALAFAHNPNWFGAHRDGLSSRHWPWPKVRGTSSKPSPTKDQHGRFQVHDKPFKLISLSFSSKKPSSMPCTSTLTRVVRCKAKMSPCWTRSRRSLSSRPGWRTLTPPPRPPPGTWP